jgi:hypothetical protein
VRGPVRVELDREHSPSAARQLGGQPTATRTEIEDELVRADSGVTNEIRSERPRPEGVLTTRAARRTRTACASLGHEPSPSSSSAVDDSHGQAG